MTHINYPLRHILLQYTAEWQLFSK